VFNGMKNNEIKNLLLLDRQTKSADHRRLQNSIEKTIERGNFEWVTLRVEENGKIKEE
jgi:predicted Holliday junction resolvase-like endonuclease